MKKIILLSILVIGSIFVLADIESKYPVVFKDSTFKEGDIIFQISKSKQSPFIQLATKSPLSHCGIIVYKNNYPYVLEASNSVKLTKLQDWINRGRGNLYWTKRILKDCPKIKYKKYLGQSYDTEFKFNNNKMYCSELVYVIYKEQFGIILCKPKKVSSYDIFGLHKILKRRHIDPNQLVISPEDIYTSDNNN